MSVDARFAGAKVQFFADHMEGPQTPLGSAIVGAGGRAVRTLNVAVSGPMAVYAHLLVRTGIASAYTNEVMFTVEVPVTNTKIIYLTFDDGPNPIYTEKILAVLDRHHAHATFFLIGRDLVRRPQLRDLELAHGDTIGNHTWNHRNLKGASQATFNDEVERTQVALGPHASSCFRPPYGAEDAHTAKYAAALGLHVQRWTVDPRDWSRPGVSTIAQRIIAGAKVGAVVLLHDGGGDRSQTVAALDLALTSLERSGWSFPALC